MYNIKMKHEKKLIIYLTIFMLLSTFLQITLPVAADSSPDLIITDDYTITPSTISHGDNVKIKIDIKNNGDENITEGTTFEVALFIDEYIPASTPVSYKIIDGLTSGAIKNVTFDWMAELGANTLIIIVDRQDNINESNENNNRKDISINVNERPTDIRINKFRYIGEPQFDEIIDVYVNITNIGESTNKRIISKLNIIKDGENLESQETSIYGLVKDGWYNFTFKWNISQFGIYALNASVTCRDKTNYSEIQDIIINPTKVEWWNNSWHYRHMIEVKESGVISKEHNFTEYLDELDIFDKSFENDTIRIIEYNDSGKIINTISEYNFNESEQYNNITNAIGILKWNVTGEFSGSRYFCVYFDVKENIGDRTSLNETKNLNATGNITNIFDVEGWWPIFINPSHKAYQHSSEIDIIVETTSLAKNVDVEKYIDDEYIELFELPDNINNTIWSTADYPLDTEGEWKFIIKSQDDAGYETIPVEYTFYVGDPDLAIESVTYTPLTIYEGDNVRINADIRTYNATVETASIAMYIDDVIYQETNETITIGQQNLITFDWIPTIQGNYSIKIIVDKDNEITELNETNNENESIIIVLGLPDIHIDNVTIPSDSVEEGQTATVIALVNNTGNADAVNYKLELYIEKENMDWTERKSITTFSLEKDKTKEINLSWYPAIEGDDWIAGVQLSSDNRNLGSGVTQRISTDKLIIEPAEKIDPVIKNIVFTNTQDQGKPIEIVAEITDESGINSSKITITNPENKSIEADMISEGGDGYSYTYTDTNIIGEYDFYIEAVDNSYRTNINRSAIYHFTITEDVTVPSISYVGAHPNIQTNEEEIKLICITSDYMGIKTVEIVVNYPDGQQVTRDMEESLDGKYVYIEIFETSGFYQFWVSVEDTTGLTIDTEDDKSSFWITSNLNDTDDDGMPDWWEEKYKFNKFDPSDAELDWDKDGYSNLQEYKSNTNPKKDVAFENLLLKIDNNIEYLGLSIGLFIILIILSYIGLRRRKQ